MATPLLLLAIAGMALVVFWYVLDEATRGGEGKSGLLGMSERGHETPRKKGNSGWKQGSSSRPWRIRRH
jgi:hypothetical protein